jgi:glutamine---fructose-6-phosphate transaminase (isomerizing)
MIDLASTHVYREIREQPAVLARLVAEGRQPARELAAEIRRREVRHVVIAARGTSDNAGRYAQYLLGAMNGLPVGLATPSLYTIYGAPPAIGTSTMVVGISQSGRSPDIVAVVAEARRQGALTTAITNAPGSDLADSAEFVIDLRAGDERAVAATKTYTAELAAIALVSAALRDDQEMFAALEAASDHVAATIEMNADIDRVAERYCYMTSCVTIGRGFNYATAFELSLKLKEMTYTLVAPYSSADFLHGPLALIAQRFPVITIAPSGKMMEEMIAFMRTAGDRGAELMVVSDDRRALGMGRVGLALPAGLPEWLSPITAIVPGQLLAMHLSHTRGFDPDRPRALNKVTETR